jgi:hypothetical protein
MFYKINEVLTATSLHFCTFFQMQYFQSYLKDAHVQKW